MVNKLFYWAFTFLVFMGLWWYLPLVVSASDASIGVRNLISYDYDTISVTLKPSDCEKDVSSYYFEVPIQGQLEFGFQFDSDCVPYSRCTVHSVFRMSGFDLNCTGMAFEYNMVIGGFRHPIGGLDYWWQKNTLEPSDAYGILTVAYSGYRRVHPYFTSAQISNDSAVNFTFDNRITCNFVSWDVYDSTNGDAIIQILNNTRALVNDNAGLVGAINHGNDLQEETNDLLEEQNQTQSGIFAKITEFFNGFFTNLGNSLLNLVVPTSAQLTEFLGRVNTWFSARLGFIWYPFDLAIRLVSAFAGGTQTSQFTIPALTLNLMGTQYTIVNSTVIDMDAFGIYVYVRLFTSFLLVSSTVSLAGKKWDEWIGGHDT